MERPEALRMVLRLSLVAAGLGLKFAAPTPTHAGGCFKCAGGQCWEAHPASTGFVYCDPQPGGACVATCSCS